MRTLTLTEASEIEFAANDNGPRTFSMTAYTGDAVDTMHGRAVVDLSGLQVGSHKKPALEGHDRKRIVGYSNDIANTGTELRVKGKVSQKTQAAKDVMELADEGFPWQASIGFGIKKAEFIKQGQRVTVNGREFEGPIEVLRETVLKENSFVPLGADGATSAAVFSDDGSAPTPIEDKAMTLTIENVKEFIAGNKEAVLELLKADTGQMYDDGFNAGMAKATEAHVTRFKALAALPGADYQWAAEQFLAGNDIEKATAALLARTAEQLKAAQAARPQEFDGIPTQPQVDVEELTEASVAAKWEADPMLQKMFPDKKLYLKIKTQPGLGR